MARYLRGVRRRGDPGIRWRAFLQNHREVIVAFGFFTVSTWTFKLLYCSFVIEHPSAEVAEQCQPWTLQWPSHEAGARQGRGRSTMARSQSSNTNVTFRFTRYSTIFFLLTTTF